MAEAGGPHGNAAATRRSTGGTVLCVLGLWLLCFAGSYGALRVLDESVTVPGAHPGIDAVLAFFVSLPIAVLTGTSLTVFRQLAGAGLAQRRLVGGRAVGLAVAGLAVEGGALVEIGLLGSGVGEWVVLVGWLAVMVGGGSCLHQVLFGLE